jgi:hypothetical protein
MVNMSKVSIYKGYHCAKLLLILITFIGLSAIPLKFKGDEEVETFSRLQGSS